MRTRRSITPPTRGYANWAPASPATVFAAGVARVAQRGPAPVFPRSRLTCFFLVEANTRSGARRPRCEVLGRSGRW